MVVAHGWAPRPHAAALVPGCWYAQDAELARLAAESQAARAALDEQYRSQATQQSASFEQQQRELQGRVAQLERSLGTALAAQQAAEADAAARGKQAAEERRLREGAEQQSAGAAAAAARREAELQAAMCAALRGHQEQLAEAGMRKAAELEALQARFLALLATKDATIAALRVQAAEAAAALGDLL